MELDFGDRLNLVTGDNGLGKSFLLDIAWWALTRKWPAEVNPGLTGGRKATPSVKNAEARIEFAFSGKVKDEAYTSTYVRKEQAWTGRPGRPANPGLVLYAMSDGSFAVWDPARNYWQTQDGVDVQDRPPAYVFSPTEVWDGLRGNGATWLCNGLIRDWANWQVGKSEPYKALKDVLRALSPSKAERLTPGDLTRISLNDVRDIPTVRMPYGQDVPVVNASSGIRRIIALAYFLVWSWEEHRRAAQQIGEKETRQIIFLIDEVESHLHPSWQRSIIQALLKVMNRLAKSATTQLITATHSPLIMASVEPLFDATSDAWFDLDLKPQSTKGYHVVLSRRPFMHHGGATAWLTSEAFDLPGDRSIEGEQVPESAAKAMSDPGFGKEAAQKIDAQLHWVLSDTNPFRIR